ncbi:MAG: ammonium transporter [Planctomycetaceae bacterium]|nr:ammonium transporter [Planctomycetaceae bacterium]
MIGTNWLKLSRTLMLLVGAGLAISCFDVGIADDPVPWGSMSVEQKLDALRDSSLQTDDDGLVSNGSLFSDMDTLWTCLAAFLVFFMQAGFALVETGFTRAKNACNIIMKNLMDFSIGTVAFWLVGFGLMFGVTEGFVGTTGFLFDADAEGAITTGSFGWAFLLFQTVFAATAATIVSGAMAERTKFISYLVYSIAITVIVYPIFGGWCWNGLVGATTVNEAGETIGGAGWLESKGFLDFAGSTVVHSIGGWCALAGAIVIGARRGKYRAGKPMPIPGHSIPLAALGVFILWLGWFGFNAGSTTAVGGASFAKICITTNMAAAAGSITAMLVSWIKFRKPDVSFALNGALAGLVSITAGCDIMSAPMAALTGGIGGIIVVFSCLLVERLRVDDPVGAVSVHGVCGAWGTLAIGLFSSEASMSQLGVQAMGVAAAFLWAFPVSFAIFYLIKLTIGLRVTEEEELAGLDISEHGMHAYPPGIIEGSVVGEPSMGIPGMAFAKGNSPVPAHQGV